MTVEQTFFIGVLADHLNKRKTQTQDSLDWSVVLSYAKNHQVEGIIYHQCKNFLPTDVGGRLAQLYASGLFYYSNRIKQYKEIASKLSEENIAFYTVKGLNVAELYPVPALRTMGDCDIIVHPKDKEKAHSMMLSLGYKNELQQDMEWTYFKNNLEFEIHDHLLYDEVVNSQISKDFTELAWEHTTVGTGGSYELDWNFHFVFLLLHLKKHFLNSGVGFRQFMDLVTVVQTQRLDWNWLKETLTKLELLDFAKVCFSFCERWFGIPMEITTSLDDSFFEASTEKIFGNGIFGFNDAENKSNHNLNQISKSGKCMTMIERIFPPYDNVKYVPHYSFVVGRPWLLPVVWIYRFFRSVFIGKGADGAKLISSAIGSDDALESRNTVLKQWGL